jgi:CheY-like chemotaxis protein
MEHTILLVQYDPEERLRVLLAFASAAPKLRLCTAADGTEAYAYLSGAGKYANRDEYPVPQLILLDIDVARESDFEIVRRLRAEVVDVKIPLIGITSGVDKSTIDRAYKFGASSCVLKSKDASTLQEIASVLSARVRNAGLVRRDSLAIPSNASRRWLPRLSGRDRRGPVEKEGRPCSGPAIG